MRINKRALKKILGELPFTAELYWRYVQRGGPVTQNFSLRRLENHLPTWRAQVVQARSNPSAAAPRRILIFASLRYWIEHTTLLAMTLAGLGHSVTLAYLPYANFRRPLNRFDARRQNAYARSVLEQAHPVVTSISLLDVKPATGRSITPALLHEIQEVALRDSQYSLQVEAVERSGDSPAARLYRLRLERDLQAAAAFIGLIEAYGAGARPDVIITPNGSILEMGAIYQAARTLGIPVVTYEFGEQRGRIWFSRNGEVMHQDTTDLWSACKGHRLTDHEWEQIRALYTSRQNGRLWENFARLWQEQPSRGGGETRRQLGLDDRPVFLLAANVIGDSLTLGRQVFSRDMTDWLERSVRFFSDRPEVQLVVRIHPGERYLKGPSVGEVVRGALPQIPDHIRLIEAPDPINTYDLIEIADLGLVYTTTVGMEMAMSGVPTLVGGRTHYRARGFTIDPETWEGYFASLERAMVDPQAVKLTRPQIESAWNYAYHFFFQYPTAFPWHLLDLWGDVERWPLERVFSPEGRQLFGKTFDYLAGEPRRWVFHPADK